MFLSRNHCLKAAQWKFDFLTTNICLKSKASRSDKLVLQNIKFPRSNYRCTGTFWPGVQWPYSLKNITECPKMWLLIKCTQITVKTQMSTILTSYETVIIPKILNKLLKWLKIFFDKRDLSFMSPSAIISRFKMHWFPNERC